MPRQDLSNDAADVRVEVASAQDHRGASSQFEAETTSNRRSRKTMIASATMFESRQPLMRFTMEMAATKALVQVRGPTGCHGRSGSGAS